MIHFDLPKQKSSILKVIGVGGGGGNAVNHMYSQNIENVDFIICNTDAQALDHSKVPNKIQLGPHLTQGLGAGANPNIGKQATEESLDEIKRILEVNTKMAFVTAGMGGGTGTGGAPIIAKICKELGILTVGICTTPFTNEGPKRMAQAENGINELRDNVDTLLVISNDKLRHQYGNLKVREAFSKADDILATAARCITDVITSNGQINVDFADVCTVMKNGGVAILGSSTAEGENRAQIAIENAVNSPLLNDSEIKGAKWILINITSSEGDHEITMDEEDLIMSYLRQQAGEDTDVIKGIGFDDSLGSKLGVTIIATGFEHKDPFKKTVIKTETPKILEEKTVLVLDVLQDTKKPIINFEQMALNLEEKNLFHSQPTAKQQEPIKITEADEYEMDKIEEEFMAKSEENPILQFELSTEITQTIVQTPSNYNVKAEDESVSPAEEENVLETKSVLNEEENSSSINSSYTLNKPSNIYAEPEYEKSKSGHSMDAQSSETKVPESHDFGMQLVEKSEIPEAADEAKVEETRVQTNAFPVEELALQDDADEQKRKAAEKIKKLRNLSFNLNSADPNNEFETVPAYIRRNMELFGNNSISSVENFYSKYTVNSNENNQTQISTINTFLDGKKPD